MINSRESKWRMSMVRYSNKPNHNSLCSSNEGTALRRYRIYGFNCNTGLGGIDQDGIGQGGIDQGAINQDGIGQGSINQDGRRRIHFSLRSPAGLQAHDRYQVPA